MKPSPFPRARKIDLLVRELPDELLVYDLLTNKALCLNQTSALVWKYCDGARPVSEIAGLLGKELKLPIDEKLVWYALSELQRNKLLDQADTPPALKQKISRREIVRALGVATVVAVPLITSIVAPTPGAPISCTPNGNSCTVSSQCCSRCCIGGTCTVFSPQICG
jgi:hypothetical protein